MVPAQATEEPGHTAALPVAPRPSPTPPPSRSAVAPQALGASTTADPTIREPPLPPPPPRKPEAGFELPRFSVRLDPFNWLIEGRLGLELEAELLPFLSLEIVPVLVVNDSPPAITRAFDDEVTQHSNGLGALAGTSIGVGLWPSGKVLEGTVVRAIFTNYGLSYRSHTERGGRVDQLSHTERHLYGYIGSHRVLGGFFTLAGGVGLGVELNRQKRCFEADGPTSDCRRDRLLLRRDSPEGETTAFDMNSWSHPVQLLFRFSLGVTF